MKGIQLSENALRKEIYKLRRELRTNLKEVRALSKEGAHFPTYALDKMRPLEKQMREKAVKYMGERELTTLYRDLKYISQLKSSTAKGVTGMSFALEPVKDKLEAFSSQKRKDFWAMYSRLYSEAPTMEKFKYELIPLLMDEFEQGGYSEDLYSRILQAFNEANRGANVTDETVRIRFTNKLNRIFHKPVAHSGRIPFNKKK